jgi:hypothetical protein
MTISNKRREYLASWRENNREKIRKQSNDYYKREISKDDSFKKKASEANKRYRQNHLEECKLKEKEKSRLRRNKDKDKYNLEQREYRRNNPEKFKNYYQENKDKIIKQTRKSFLKKKFNITQEEVDQIKISQEGKCAVCKITFDKTPHIDHCHETGKVRALLCSPCNITLGYLEKLQKLNSEILLNFAEYLKIHSN